MSVGVWSPDGDKEAARSVDHPMLEKCLALAATIAEVVSAQDLEAAGLHTENWLMDLEPAAWEVAKDLDADGISKLIRFFTLVEMNVSGWEAGKKSPVIPLVRILKDRGEFDPTLRKWIKANTDNRYLPYGSAL
jgi:hypothetical protein